MACKLKSDTIAVIILFFGISISGLGNGIVAPTNILLIILFILTLIRSLFKQSCRINIIWLCLASLYLGLLILSSLLNNCFGNVNFLSIVRGILIAT